MAYVLLHVAESTFRTHFVLLDSPVFHIGFACTASTVGQTLNVDTILNKA